MLNEVELILHTHKAEAVLFFEFEQGEVSLHLEDDHVLGQLPARVVAEFEFHAVGFQEFEGLFGIFDRNLFCHFGEAQSVESFAGNAEGGEEVGVGDFVPHLHGARADGSIDRAFEGFDGGFAAFAVVVADVDVNEFGKFGHVASGFEEGFQRFFVFGVVRKIFHIDAAGFDVHLGEAALCGKQADGAGEVRQNTTEH